MKKKLNIVLLLLVLGLWGTVVYKYVSQYFVKNEITDLNKNESTLIDLKIKEKDTFRIIQLNRDPFLNKKFSSDEPKPVVFIQEKRTIEVPKLPTKPIVSIPFPTINYLGYIKSKEKQYEMALLKVNGKFFKLKINETKDKIKIISISKDSVKVRFSNEEKSFSLNGASTKN
jgi:hypothetical protein